MEHGPGLHGPALLVLLALALVAGLVYLVKTRWRARRLPDRRDRVPEAGEHRSPDNERDSAA